MSHSTELGLANDRVFLERLAAAVDQAMVRPAALFGDLAAKTADVTGVTRAPYGKGEQYAHDLLARHARALDLETRVDPAGNLYMTLPGRDRCAPAWLVGSHLDSVPCGGNYDGAAGVIAGIAAIEAMQRMNHVPAQDTTVMAIRAEETSWFAGKHGAHFGSRLALGLMKAEELDTAVRIDSGRTLANHMAECGCDPDAVRRGAPFLQPAKIKGYLELHIEQGPALEQKKLPVGVVTGIRGNSRLRNARCLGTYNHGGATPQVLRHDAVIATSELVLEVDRAWRRIDADGRDLVFTFGKMYTNPQVHGLSKVPGEVGFTLDLRSGESEVLAEMRGYVENVAHEIGKHRGVRFELGAFTISEPAVLDLDLRGSLLAGCKTLSIPAAEIASGGGHDAAEFTRAGVPAAMIFVRNQNGSHVAEESMEMADFALGTRLLSWMLATR